MYMHDVDYIKERDSGQQNMYHHHGWFANLNLPDNPLCWLKGHTPSLHIHPLTHPNGRDGITEYRWIECKVCGRRSTRQVPPSPTPINYEGILKSTDCRNGWQGRDAEFSAETVVRKPVSEASVRFHLGSRGSETPVDVHLTVAGTGIYLSTSLFSRTADVITQSKGRELKLSLYDGSLCWKLWTDEDHSCSSDKMRRFGGKYRSWLCRDGSISVKPLDYLYGGSPKYSYTDVDGPKSVLLVTAEGTEHNVDLTLQRQRLSRPKGPYTESWIVKWESKEGIPVRHNDWKGDCFYSSAVKLPGDNKMPYLGDWVTEALDALRIRVTKDRNHYEWKQDKTSDV